MFFADGHSTGDVGSGPRWFLEPLTALSAMAWATERIGLVSTVSTTFWTPFHAARMLASLDHISGGRAGWNVVTSMFDAEARNHGLPGMPPHDERYARAEEYTADLKRRITAAGRDPGSVAVMPGLVTYVGSTEREALARQAAVDALLPAEQALAQLSTFVQQDCSGWELDAPVPDLPPLEGFTGPKGRYATILRIVAVERPTVRQLLGRLAAGGAPA